MFVPAPRSKARIRSSSLQRKALVSSGFALGRQMFKARFFSKSDESVESQNDAKDFGYAYEKVDGWGRSFVQLMADPRGKEVFRLFLIGEQSQANLEFCDQVKEFRTLRNREKMRNKAAKLCETFLAPDSPNELNIRWQDRKKVIDVVESKRNHHLLTEKTFDDCHKVVQKDLERDTYARFTDNQLYRSLLHQSIPLEVLDNWRKDFKALISHRVGSNLFRQFLKAEHALENWEFWQAVQSYKQLRLPEPEMKKRAIMILKNYMSDESKAEVNIDSVTKRQIKQQLDREATSSLFHEAELQIQKSIMNDSFARFGTSTVYRDFVGKVKHLKTTSVIEEFMQSDQYKRAQCNRSYGSTISVEDIKLSATMLSYSVVKSWQSSFERLLDHDVGTRLFKLFLQEQHCDENILFYEAVQSFQATFDKTKSKAEATKIMEKHLSPQSEKEVNVSADVKKELAAQIQGGKLNAETFAKAASQIYKNMERDSFARFLNSNFYKFVLQQQIASTEVADWAKPKSFNKVINHPEGYLLFCEFLDKEKATENLRFYEAVQNFKALNLPAEELKKRAKSICSKFLEPGSVSEVNIDGRTKKEILANVAKGKVSTDVFAASEVQILKSIENDSHSRFGISSVYKDYVEQHEKLKKADFTKNDLKNVMKSLN